MVASLMDNLSQIGGLGKLNCAGAQIAVTAAATIILQSTSDHYSGIVLALLAPLPAKLWNGGMSSRRKKTRTP
jgi:hypothetical protein